MRCESLKGVVCLGQSYLILGILGERPHYPLLLWTRCISWLLPKVVKSGGPCLIPQHVLRPYVYGRDAYRRLYGHTHSLGSTSGRDSVCRHMMLHMSEIFSPRNICITTLNEACPICLYRIHHKKNSV